MADERDLLFGVLALQNGLIDQDQLATALRALVTDTGRTLADQLAETGALGPDGAAATDAVVDVQLRRHGGDAGAALTTVPVERSTIDRLLAEGDPELTATVTKIVGASVRRGGDGAVAGGAGATGGQRFQLVRPHAKGGLGAVFVAIDTELNREVALKQILDRHADDESSRRRFLLEAEITGGLEHPGIVPVHGLGTYGDGRPYYAMRFVRGDTLKDAIADFHREGASSGDPAGRALGLRTLLRKFTDVCNAMDYAHSRGVLHRDIKPANVIVGRHGETLVVDWGLAKAVGRADPDSPVGDRPLVPSSGNGGDGTLPGAAMGTPAFMSPEQAAGDPERIGHRSDVYSLGATLYCILTGKVPFEGGNVASILWRVGRGDFPSPRSLDPTIDRALEAVCLKAMAREPGDRYPSCRALAEDLERWAADEAVGAWEEPWSRRARRWARRNRTVVAGAAVALVATAVALGAIALVQAEARRKLAKTNRELEGANKKTARALGLAERRVDLALSAIDNFRSAIDDNLDVKYRPEAQPLRQTLLKSPLAFYQKLRDDLMAAEDARPEDRVRLADAYYQIGVLDREIGVQAEALTAWKEAVAILDPLARPGPSAQRGRAVNDLARVLQALGALYSDSGQPESAFDALLRARGLRASQVLEAPQDVAARLALASLLLTISGTESRSGQVEPALTTLRGALAALEGARLIDPGNVKVAAMTGRVHRQTGSILSHQRGQFEAALLSIGTALKTLVPLADAHPDDMELRYALAQVHADLAFVHEKSGRVEEALGDHRRRLAVIESMTRARPTVTGYRLDLVRAMSRLADTESRLGRPGEALGTFRKALGIAQELVRDNPTNLQYRSALADQWTSIGMQEYALGRVAEALNAMEKSAAAHEELVRAEPTGLDNRRELAGMRYNIALMNQSLGNSDGALTEYGKALGLREALAREFPDDPRFRFDVASTLGNIAAVHFAKDRLSEALALFRRSVDILSGLSKTHPENVDYRSYLTRAQRNYGFTLVCLGRFPEAEPELTRALAGCEALLREQPKVVLYRFDLALAHQYIGLLSRRARRLDAAERSLRASMDALAALNGENPDDIEVLENLGTCYVALGRVAADRGDAAGALGWNTRAVTLLAPSAKQGTRLPALTNVLKNALRDRARAKAGLGDRDGALADWAESTGVSGERDADSAEAGRALVAAWAGDHARALQLVQDAAGQSGLKPGPLEELARAASLAAGAFESDRDLPAAERQQRAGSASELAVTLLRRSVAAGGVAGESERVALDLDPDFKPLRDRNDYRALMLDLAFPADPFAQ